MKKLITILAIFIFASCEKELPTLKGWNETQDNDYVTGYALKDGAEKSLIYSLKKPIPENILLQYVSIEQLEEYTTIPVDNYSLKKYGNKTAKPKKIDIILAH